MKYPSKNAIETRMSGYIQIVGGNKFYPLEPRLHEINIKHIAHALSNICRFGGHTNEFYSVAQHSVFVSKIVTQEFKPMLYALLHDGSEAYLGDIVRPLKRMDHMKAYRHAEDWLQRMVYEVFYLQPSMPQAIEREIKDADSRVLFTEKRDLLDPMDWGYEVEPMPDKIVPLPPKQAFELFMDRFLEINKSSFIEAL